MADSRPPSPTSTDSRSSSPVRSIQSHASKKPEGPPSEDSTPPTTPGSYPTVVPLPNAKGRRRKMFGMKHAAVNPQRGNDPFDYEQKYGEDEEFKEMGSMAHLWKVFLDECAKFDAEMVDDWRDGLDVLLVFAGLFSAVVTTFVAQTCQRLEADFTEVNAHLMYESINIDRARAAGLSILEVPRSQLTPFSRVRPSQTAVWVNGLWFTSLALSLTTALMAVLTKQWIHQYMSVPSGTPRDRSRIRQFRYMSLQRWQVPVIIGLLPVLMHIALGVFFAGLIVYLYSLNTAMSGVITGIASTAFIVYFLTNLLPLYKPDCPYKTPLTIHSYAFLISVWDRVRTLTKAGESLPSKDHLSLKAVEQETVVREADTIDAQSVAWLHNVSSNSSVQRIVLQALSNLPLEVVDVVRSAIPTLEESLRQWIREYNTPDRTNGRERLCRALTRFDSKPNFFPDPLPGLPVQNSLSVLLNSLTPGIAAQFLQDQVVHPTARFDVISWAKILRNALQDGIDWMHVEHYESASFIRWFFTRHVCLPRHHARREIASMDLFCISTLPPGIRKYSGSKFIVFSSHQGHTPPLTDGDGVDFKCAMTDFLYPSMCNFLASSVFSSYHAVQDDSLPSDIRLHLSLLHVPCIQTASAPSRTSSSVGIVPETSPLGQIIYFIRLYVDVELERAGTFGGPLSHHPSITRAVFSSIATLVKSNAFKAHLPLYDQQDVLHPLFRVLVLDGTLRRDHADWITRALLRTLRQTTFSELESKSEHTLYPFPLIAEILDYFFLTKSLLGLDIYRELLQREWLECIQWEYMLNAHDPHHRRHFRRTPIEYEFAFPFLVASYLDGLEILMDLSLDLYLSTLEYIKKPPNLTILCKILILADIESRSRMWKLAKLVGRDAWLGCKHEIDAFVCTSAAKEFYDEQSSRRCGGRPFHDLIVLKFSSYELLPSVVEELFAEAHWVREAFPLTTPVYSTPSQIEDFAPDVFVNRWVHK